MIDHSGLVDPCLWSKQDSPPLVFLVLQDVPTPAFKLDTIWNGTVLDHTILACTHLKTGIQARLFEGIDKSAFGMVIVNKEMIVDAIDWFAIAIPCDFCDLVRNDPVIGQVLFNPREVIEQVLNDILFQVTDNDFVIAFPVICHQ